MLIVEKPKKQNNVHEKMLNGLGVLWQRSSNKNVMSKSVSSVLDNMLGEDLKETVMYHLKKYDVGPSDALMNPNKFVTALERVLGPGALIIENAIIRDLSSEFEFKLRSGYYFENNTKTNFHSPNSVGRVLKDMQYNAE